MKKYGIIPFRDGFNPLAGPAAGDPELSVEWGFLALPGKERYTSGEKAERAFLLLKGDVMFRWGDRQIRASRTSWKNQGPYCLHVPAETEVRIDGIADHSELTVYQTENEASFPARLVAPDDVWDASRGEPGTDAAGGWNVRKILVPDGRVASALALGETVLKPGHWSRRLDKRDIPPEAALFQYEPPNGFGLVKSGEQACLSTENTVVKLLGGSGFMSVSAPGYWQYCVWCARSRPDGPGTGRKRKGGPSKMR